MSGSLNFDDRHRLVEAILRIDAMRVQRDRGLYLSALEKELGHPLPFVRHDQDRLDVWALVSACLDYPGAAHALLRILERFHPGSISVRAFGDVVHELLPDPWLDQAERRDLHQLVTLLERADPELSHLTRLSLLYRRAVGPAWPLQDREIHSLHDIVALLEESPVASDGVPPLLRFVSDLAEYSDGPTAPAFRAWVVRQVETLKLDRALLQGRRKEIVARTVRKPSETYLVIECLPDAIEPDHYVVTAWLQVDGEPGTTLRSDDQALPISRIPKLLEGLLVHDGSAVIDRRSPDLTIEFVLPRALLGHPVEQFKINLAGLEYRIGIRHPVVVRSLDRMRLAAVHHSWRHKWAWLRGNAVDSPICLVEQPGQYDHEELFSKLSEVSPAVLALAFPPWGRAGSAQGHGAEPDEHWVGLLAGVPVIAWCRDGRDPVRFAKEVKELLADDLMALPQRTMLLRRQALSHVPGDRVLGDRVSGDRVPGDRAPNDSASDQSPQQSPQHLGLHLTLIFDDADRIPEPYARLRSPA